MLFRIELAITTGKALRNIFAVNKPAPAFGASEGREQQDQRMVAELDSALNNWLNKLPAHLNWSPSRDCFAVYTDGSVC